MSASLAVLAALAVFSLVLPNLETSAPGPVYTASQLAFVSVVAIVLYGAFVLVQTASSRLLSAARRG